MPIQFINGVQFIDGEEHKEIDLSISPEKIKEIKEYIRGKEKPEILGLHYSHDGNLRLGNFIGAVWIGEGDKVLIVESKFSEPKMDYLKMFAECCEHPQIGGRMLESKCFECWADKEPIELPEVEDFSMMIVIAYLRELNQLCTRRLRRHFERRQENFTGKVKGKILIGENIRRNVVHARPDRIFCEYQSISDNILENQILRAALEKAARYMSQDKMANKYKSLYRWIHACRAHLQGVSVTHISRRDFAAARKRGVFSFYRRPLNLAKAVLFHFGFNPHEEVSEKTLTPPYAINSAKLFEYYAELHLRKKHSKRHLNVQKGYSKGIPVYPDFYFSCTDGKPWIIDAKYKKVSENFENQDLYQIIAYSRHCGLLSENIDIMEKEKADSVELSLVYPHVAESEEKYKLLKDKLWKEKTIDAFLSPITIYKIRCPVKATTTEEPPSQ